MTIKKPDERVQRYLKLYMLRRNDQYSEDQIASALGFGSPRALYKQLRTDKHPVCTICGALPVEERHCKPPTAPKRQVREGGSEASQLPPAENAMRLITPVLNHLLLFEVGKLKRREEHLEGGRFVVEREEWKYWWLGREDFSEEEWRRYCEEHGVDLEVDEVPVTITPTGGRFVELKREMESWIGMVPEALDGLAGAKCNQLYRLLRLEITPTPECGYQVEGAVCTSELRS
jgi:hypothetical protein